MLRAGLLIAVAALVALPGAHALDVPVVSVAGIARGTMVPCPAGDELTVTGTSNADGTWTFEVVRVEGVPHLGCDPVQGGVFRGAWDPSIGGCIGAVVSTDVDGFCLGPVTRGTTESDYELCKGFYEGNCHGCSIGRFSGAAA